MEGRQSWSLSETLLSLIYSRCLQHSNPLISLESAAPLLRPPSPTRLQPATRKPRTQTSTRTLLGLFFVFRVPKSSSEANPLWKPGTQLVDGLFVPPNDAVKRNKLAKKQIKDTAGTNWFDMPAPTMTPELQKDLQLLKFRNGMDPKRHYKKGDAQPNKYFQVGTVIESPLDFFSSRLTNKERKVSLAEEVLSDRNLGNYRKRKVREIEEKNRPGGNEKWKIKGKGSRQRAKQRRHSYLP